jgi:hypothetical protein
LEYFEGMRKIKFPYLSKLDRVFCDVVGIGIEPAVLEELGGKLPAIPFMSRIPCLEAPVPENVSVVKSIMWLNHDLTEEWWFQQERFPGERALCHHVLKMLQVSQEEYTVYLTSSGDAAIRVRRLHLLSDFAFLLFSPLKVSPLWIISLNP